MSNDISSLPTRVRTRVTRAFAPRQTIDRQNAWHLYGDIAWFGVLFAVAQSFLSVFTIRLGGSDTHVGLLSSLPALVTIFASIPGSRLVERENKPLPVLVNTAILNRVGYLAIGLMPFFVLTHRADIVIVLFGLLTIPGAMANVAFTTLFAHAVKTEDRPHIVSVRNILLGITTTLTALIAGRFLDLVTFPLNYQFLFILAFAASMLSIYHLMRLQMPPASASDLDAKIIAPRGAREFIAMLRGSGAFARFTTASVLLTAGLWFAIPLYSIYWVRVLNASEGWIGIFSMVNNGTSIFFFPVWARIASRYGNRAVLIATSVGLAGFPLFTALAPSVEWVVPICFWGGVFTAGFQISFFNGLLDVCPAENRASFIAAFNTLINVAAFLSPLLSSSLTAFVSVQMLLLIGAGLRILGALMMWRRS
ncbi:MAG: MFS transporter [Chloroflexi bacterium]|nr:MFS transporter [Chloroflexota bacterium]